MSFPPGTEMFQFPGFASSHYVFMMTIPLRVGCPIRISTDQRLLAAPRGFSQRATSFIASWCQGIHRMPFSYSISRIRPRRAEQPHHAQKPSSAGHASARDDHLEHTCAFRSTPIIPNGRCTRSSRARKIHPVRSFTAPLNPRRPTVGAPFSRTTLPGQTIGRTTGRPPVTNDRSRHHTRPETHQNLIHTYKEQHDRPTSAGRRTT